MDIPCLGIDIAKVKFNVCLLQSNGKLKHKVFLNNAAGFAQLQEWLMKLPPLEYPAHFEKRYVSFNGGIRWKSAWVHVSLTCAGEYLGLEAVDNQIWNVYFGPLRLGRLSGTTHAHRR